MQTAESTTQLLSKLTSCVAASVAWHNMSTVGHNDEDAGCRCIHDEQTASITENRTSAALHTVHSFSISTSNCLLLFATPDITE